MLLCVPNLKSKACTSCADFVCGVKRKIIERRKCEENKMNFEGAYFKDGCIDFA